MSKVRESEREMKGAADKTQFRVSEDKWSYVQSNMSSASSGMLAYWNDKARAASDKCQRLEQGEKHPDIDAYPKLAACESSDKTELKLDTDVVTYEMCSGTVKNQLGQQLDEATLEVSESGE